LATIHRQQYTHEQRTDVHFKVMPSAAVILTMSVGDSQVDNVMIVICKLLTQH